jgi:hypothetical protein
MDIFSTNDTFNFEKLTMTKPIAVPGGNYFIKCSVNTQPLYIQPPKCKTRQGIVKAGVGKRLYSDLMFTNENEDFIRWMENLENYCQQYIYKNREKWFDGEMELHDIENYFTSPLKVFKSGKYYIIRTNVTTVLGKPVLKIYDENENELDYDSINENTHIMTILEIQGIKCSSKSFQIEIELKQMMVLQPTNIFEKCIIKTTVIPKNNIECGGFSEPSGTDENKKNNMSIADDSTPINGEGFSVGEPAGFSTLPPKGAEELSGLAKLDEGSNLDQSGIDNEDLVVVERSSSVQDDSTNPFSVDSPLGLSMENRRSFAPPGGSVGVPKEPNLESLRSEDRRSSTLSTEGALRDSLAKRPDANVDISEKLLISNNDGLEEVEFHLEELMDSEPFLIKKRDNIYYEMYKEAKKKAKIARDLALSAYLEAKRIKNTYMLDDIEDDDDDNEFETESDDDDDDDDEENI